jgi:hypothetical protein
MVRLNPVDVDPSLKERIITYAERTEHPVAWVHRRALKLGMDQIEKQQSNH